MASEERFLIEAAQRDPTRFAELYEEHFPRIYAYVAKRVHERDAAQDLTAEVFQSALANLQRYEWRGVPFAAWLYRIAANAVADHWKKVSRPSGSGWAIARDESDAIERRTTLFRLVRHPHAPKRHAALAQRHIWCRRFDWADDLLRFGLPPDDAGLDRLAVALRD